MIDEYIIELASRFSCNLHEIINEKDSEKKDKLILDTIEQIARQKDIPMEWKLDYIDNNPCLHYLSNKTEIDYESILQEYQDK